MTDQKITNDSGVQWKIYFQNFSRAYSLLCEPVERGLYTLSSLEKEGFLHRFKWTFSLAWDALRRYLEENGYKVGMPTTVIDAAFTSKIISDKVVWLEMLKHRSQLGNSYNKSNLEEAITTFAEYYVPAMAELRQFLAVKSGE